MDGLPAETHRILSDALTGVDQAVVLRGDEALGPAAEGAGAAAVARVLRENPGGVRVLRLHDVRLRDGGSAALFRELQRWDPANPSRLQELGLTRTGTGVGGARELARVFLKNISITSLDLSFNPLGDGGAEALAEALRPTDFAFCTLERLVLRRCRVGARGAVALGRSLRGNETLHVLNLSGNRVGDPGAAALAEALARSTGSGLGIQVLTVSDGGIGSSGMAALAAALADNGNVTEFRACGNRCGDDAANPVSLALRRQATLVLLQLSGCALGDGAAQTLAPAIGGSPSLEVVHLACNGIGDLGVTALARCAEDNTSLRELSLHDNTFAAKGFRALAATLLSNHTLVTLDLAGNDLSDVGAAEVFADAIRGNEALMSLDLSRCQIVDASAECLVNAIENNQYLAKLSIGRNLLGKDHQGAFDFAMGRPRKPAGALLDQMETARRQQMMADETDGARALAVPDALPAGPTTGDWTGGRADDGQGQGQGQGGGWGTEQQGAKQREVDPVVSMMKPGQALNCPVAYGRKDNIMTELLFTTDTTLVQAREMVRQAIPNIDDGYKFVSLQGRLIPTDEEDKRCVLWDCGRLVCLRPNSWLSL